MFNIYFKGVNILIDYHLHSTYSMDGKMTMEEACIQAIELGLKEIVFTDHVELCWPGNNTPFDINSLSGYLEHIDEVADKYSDKLTIKKGMELGLEPDRLDTLSYIVDTYPVDFIIGSVHVIDGQDPYLRAYYDGKTKEESYIRYYTEILNIIKRFDKFSVLGHLDYVKRYSPFQWDMDDYKIGYDIIDEILKLLIQKGKGIEINTSGYRHISEAPMPHFNIIKRYKELGGKVITIGSDAHTTEHMAFRFDDTIKSLQNMGITSIATFSNMQPSFITL